MDIDYEKVGTDILRTWTCQCGAMLKEDNITDMEMYYDEKRKEVERAGGTV